MSESYLEWISKSIQPIINQPDRPGCAVCKSEFLRGGSFVFAPGGVVLDLCAIDSRRLHELPAIQREEAVRELIGRVSMDLTRWLV